MKKPKKLTKQRKMLTMLRKHYRMQKTAEAKKVREEAQRSHEAAETEAQNTRDLRLAELRQARELQGKYVILRVINTIYKNCHV